MNKPVELTEDEKDANKLQQFEAKLRAAEIDADNNSACLEDLVKLAEDAISLTTIEEQSLFTYFDGDKRYEYFSTTKTTNKEFTENTFYCEDKNGKKTRMQPKTFVDRNLSMFSAYALLKTLHTVVFGGEDGPRRYRKNTYPLQEVANRPTDENGTYF